MSSKERILLSAIELFAEKGKYGTRMEEVAQRAGVNKAMLYYYYSSKDNLFREVLRTILSHNFGRIFASVGQIADGPPDFAARVQAVSGAFFKVFSESPAYTKILFAALAGEPQEVRKIVRALRFESEIVHPERMLELFREGIAQCAFRDMDPGQIVISIIGMNLIYFLAKPIAEVLLDLDVADEAAFLAERESSIIRLLLHGILEGEK